MSTDAPPPIHPEQALGPGRGDAATVVGFWFLRRAFLPLGFFGIAVAWLGGRTDPSVEWTSPAEVAEDLLSPLAVLIIAVGVRVTASIGALTAALPMAFRSTSEFDADSSRLTRLNDTFRTARGLRALRWTSPVRRLAVDRLGPASDGSTTATSR